MTKSSTRNNWRQRIRRRGGLLAMLALATPVVIGAVHLDDPDVLLYPLPSVVYEAEIDLTGNARPYQTVEIEINGAAVARTVSNETGDFVVRIRPDAAVNNLRAYMPEAAWSSDSGLQTFHHAPEQIVLAEEPAEADADADANSFATQATDVTPMVAPAAPVLTAPPATTSANPITISGTAAPSTTIRYYVNGRYVRAIAATATGTFSTWVPLEDGANAIYVTAANAQGEISLASNTVQTTYTNAVPRTQTGSVSQNAVWTKGNGAAYSITGNLTIPVGVTLWIQPGVVVNVAGNYKILTQGTFVTSGISTARVVLKATTTSCNGTARRTDWLGIEVAAGGTANVDYAQIQCADAAVHYIGGKGYVKRSQIINNNRGVRTIGASASVIASPAINTTNEFRNNYYGISIQKNSKPTISAGNIFDNNAYGILIEGASDATQDPVPVISNSQILPTNGTGIYTSSFATTQTPIINAKGNWWGTTDHGVIASEIYDWNDNPALPIVDFSGYLKAAGSTAYFTGTTLLGTVTANTTLAAGEAQTLGNVIVNSGVTLTLSAGTKLNLATGARLQIKGGLTVAGTSAARAVIRPSTPSCNGTATKRQDWAGIEVVSGGTASINFAEIHCATRGVHFNSGTGSVKNTKLLNNYYGVEMVAVAPARTTPSITTANEIRGSSNAVVVRQNTSPTISGSQFDGSDYGIAIIGNRTAVQNPLPIIKTNSFQTIAINFIYASDFGTARSVRIDATGNWWGTVDPGIISTEIRDWTEDQTYAPVVDFSGYLNAAGGTAAWTGQTLNGPITANKTLTAVEHLMLGRVEVDPAIVVTANAGAKITPVTTDLRFAVKGTLNVSGTSAARVVFKPSAAACTSTSKNRSDWVGLIFQAGSSGTISYADIYCAVNGIYVPHSGAFKNNRLYGNAVGMYIQGTSTAVSAPTIQGSEIRNNEYGIYISDYASPVINAGNLVTENVDGIYVYGTGSATGRPAPVVNGNSILANTSYDYIAKNFTSDASTIVLNARSNWWGSKDPAVITPKIYDHAESGSSPHVDFSGYLAAPGGSAVFTGTTLIGHVTANRTLAAGQYQVLGSFVVDPGITLTVNGGANIGFLPGRALKVSGSLVAMGTSTQRVVFGSLATYPAKGDWFGVQALAGGNMQIEHARVEYSTYGIVFTGGQGSVKESLSRFNTYGILVEAKSSPTLSPNNEITSNDYGVWVLGDSNTANNPIPVTTSNNIYGNSEYNYGARSFGTPAGVTLNAASNWWGMTDVTAIRAKIYTGSSTSPVVDIGTPRVAATGPLAIQISNAATTVRQVQPLDSAVPARGVFTTSRGGSVKTEIRRQSDNAVVYQYTQNLAAPGDYDFAWNGRTAAGAVVAAGMYRAVLTASDGRDSYVADFKPVAGVSTTSGDASSIYKPFQNEFYKATVNLNEPGLVSLRITPQGGTAFYAWENVYYPAGANWVYWDGRNPAGNVITVPVSILVTDSTSVVPTAIQVLATKPAITGLLPAPNIEVKADPYLVTHSYEQLTRMAYRLSADSYVRFVLLPPGEVDIRGSAAIVLVDNQLQSAKNAQGAPLDHVVEWRGYDVANPSRIRVTTEGAYTFAIEAKESSTNQTTLYRGAVNLRQ